MTKTLRFDEIALSIADRVDDPTSAGVTQYVGLEHLDPDSIEITRFGTPEDVSATKLRFYPGDVIYARRRAYQKKLGVARFEGICSAHALVLRARAESCLPGFLPYFLHSDQFHNRALEISVGSLSPTINWSTLKHQVFRMPSLDEQERILELLSVVDAHAEALRNQAKAAEDSRRVVLHELLTAGGEGWTETTLGELCELYQPVTISKAEMDDAAPYIVYGANGPVGRYSRFNHEEPEVVVTCRGATCGVVNMTPPNCWITGNAMVVKPRDNRSIKGFLFWALQTSIDVQAAISGSAQPQITRTGLAPSKILVPPVGKQKKIVDEISKIDALLQETNSALLATQQLRSALLNKEIS